MRSSISDRVARPRFDQLVEHGASGGRPALRPAVIGYIRLVTSVRPAASIASWRVRPAHGSAMGPVSSAVLNRRIRSRSPGWIINEPQSVSAMTMRPPGRVMRFASRRSAAKIADVLDHSFHPHGVAVAGWKPGVSSVPGKEFNGDALALRAVVSRFDHGGARVDADRGALRADDASNAEQLRARAAPDVTDHVAGKRREFGEYPRLHLLQRGETLPVVQKADELLTELLVPTRPGRTSMGETLRVIRS